MARKNNFFKKLIQGRKKSLTCQFDPGTNAYYCCEKVQGVYERVSGPYRTLDECRANSGAE